MLKTEHVLLKTLSAHISSESASPTAKVDKDRLETFFSVLRSVFQDHRLVEPERGFFYN